MFSNGLLALALLAVAPTTTTVTPTTATATQRTVSSRADAEASALAAAGFDTLGRLAEARKRKVARVVGRRRAKALIADAKRHVGEGSLVDASTPLTASFLLDSSIVVEPVLRSDRATQAALARAQGPRDALARAGILTYHQLVDAPPATVSDIAGRRGLELQQAARNLAGLAGIIVQDAKVVAGIIVQDARIVADTAGTAGAKCGTSAQTGALDSGGLCVDSGRASGVIAPAFFEQEISPAFVADPTLVVGAAPTPHP